MPLYEFGCKTCDSYTQKVLPLSEYENVPECCGKPMSRILSAPSALIQDIQPYRSMINGKMITSRREHRTHLKDHGCVEVGNEKQKPRTYEDAPGLKDAIIHSVNKHWKDLKNPKKKRRATA